tara:strand:+ start:259 stop:456 length:198 start_codon:yes stop_codon:yes gene_type:complete
MTATPETIKCRKGRTYEVIGVLPDKRIEGQFCVVAKLPNGKRMYLIELYANGKTSNAMSTRRNAF